MLEIDDFILLWLLESTIIALHLVSISFKTTCYHDNVHLKLLPKQINCLKAITTLQLKSHLRNFHSLV